MRASQLQGRSRLADLLREHADAEQDMEQQRARFERLKGEHSRPRVVSSLNLFQTPPDIAEQVAGLFPIFGRTLEPSAGLGRLYRAIRSRSDCPLVLVDNSAECCRELRRMADHNTEVIEADFLECSLGEFDSIVMNPPFKMGADIRHIRHALTMLAPGGRLVSICAAGNKRRDALGCVASEWVDLPPASFKSEGTRVDACIVVIDK